MLAWLIDFPYRPFDYTKDYTSLMEMQTEAGKPEEVGGDTIGESQLSEDAPEVDNEDENIVDFSHSEPHIQRVKQKWKFLKVAVVGVGLTVIGMGGYWGWNAMQQVNGGCMYWAGDHFQPVLCNQAMPNAQIIALDTTKVKYFKKITCPDTITRQAIGHVWYSKIDNNIEFFTADGMHPVFIERRLKPITDYIINKYIHTGMITNK